MNRESFHKTMETALREERPLQKAPAGFSDRVIDALPSRAVASRDEVLPAQSLWPRLALAAALAAVGVLAWFQFSRQTQDVAPVMARAPVETRPLDLKLPPITVSQVQALTERIDQPLEQELERVLADTRNAIQFVAANFTP
jgi:hypothetical protein